MKRHADNAAYLLFGGLIAVGLLYLLVPVMIALAMSLDPREFLGRFPPPGLSLRWYGEFFTDPYYLNALGNTAIVALLTTILSTAIGVLAAVLIDRYRFPGRDLLSAFFLSPLIVPNVINAFTGGRFAGSPLTGAPGGRAMR